MDFSANETPVEVIKEDTFRGLILETFILILMESSTKRHGKNLIGWKKLIRSIIAQNIMSASTNMVLNAEHR